MRLSEKTGRVIEIITTVVVWLVWIFVIGVFLMTCGARIDEFFK